MMTQVRMAVTGRIVTTAYRYRRTLVFGVAIAVASLLASGDPYGARVPVWCSSRSIMPGYSTAVNTAVDPRQRALNHRRKEARHVAASSPCSSDVRRHRGG